jgi:hypothetical protein
MLSVGVRLALALWSARRFPPAADGVYFDVLASRIAEGQGYTWLWPDGAVTPAAHYPVGYPALLAALRVLFGRHPLVALLPAVLSGFAVAPFAERLPLRASMKRSLGVLLALCPALLLYTPALMTEAWVALALAALLAFAWHMQKPWQLWVLSLFMGTLVLVRPQLVLMAPLLGLGFAGMRTPPSVRRRIQNMAIASLLTIALCLPWTARNCREMHACALVSVNGGWNLLIGTQTNRGAWEPLSVPEGCTQVFDEASKDACFKRAALHEITQHPIAWLLRMPAKLRVTFDYFGAGPWYLHESNASVLGDAAKTVFGALETLVHRGLLLAALLAAALPRKSKPGNAMRRVLSLVGAGCTLLPGGGFYAHAALALAALRRKDALGTAYAWVFAATALTHAVFFGAGRYGLLVVPWVCALAMVFLAEAKFPWNTQAVLADQAIAGSGSSEPEQEESPSSKECNAG